MNTTNPHPRSLVRVRLGAGLAMLLVLAACSKAAGSVRPSESALGSPRPSSPAHVRILAPTDGQVFKGTSVEVPVQLALSGARIVPATTQHITPDTGHVHIFLDNQIVAMNFKLTDVIPNVRPGLHVLRAEFVASDHLPFDPRVFTSVTFRVEP